MPISCLLVLTLLGASAAFVPPEGFERSTTTHFSFSYPPGLAPVAADLMAQAPRARQKIYADLGVPSPDQIEVFVCDGLACMEQVAPGKARIPPWAAGMAFGRHDRILIRADGRTARGQGLDQVFLHELAHLALNQAVGHQSVPRWFHEGFAIYQSGEWSMGRVTALGAGVLSGRLFSLEALTDSFPDSPPDVELAYAQSIDFVAYLLGTYGRASFHRLIALLGRGWSFVNAVEEAYEQGIFRIEADWHADLKLRFTWLPVITGATSLWVVATLVLVAAWLRKRRARRLGLARMSSDSDAPDDPDNAPPPPLTADSP